eukprot:9304680-Pyramimonas_sp.AAC.1
MWPPSPPRRRLADRPSSGPVCRSGSYVATVAAPSASSVSRRRHVGCPTQIVQHRLHHIDCTT